MNSIFETAKFSDVCVSKMTTIELTFHKSKLVKYNELINQRITLEGADTMLAKIVKSYNGISVSIYMILISIRK